MTWKPQEVLRAGVVDIARDQGSGGGRRVRAAPRAACVCERRSRRGRALVQAIVDAVPRGGRSARRGQRAAVARQGRRPDRRTRFGSDSACRSAGRLSGDLRCGTSCSDASRTSPSSATEKASRDCRCGFRQRYIMPARSWCLNARREDEALQSALIADYRKATTSESPEDAWREGLGWEVEDAVRNALEGKRSLLCATA